MSIAIPQELKNAYPEFTNLTDPQVQDALDAATSEIEPVAWGSRAKRGEIALAAHLLSVSGVLTAGAGLGGSGPIASITVGDVSVSYGGSTAIAVMNQGLNVSLASTRYGLEYSRLVKLAAYGAEVL